MSHHTAVEAFFHALRWRLTKRQCFVSNSSFLHSIFYALYVRSPTRFHITEYTLLSNLHMSHAPAFQPLLQNHVVFSQPLGPPCLIIPFLTRNQFQYFFRHFIHKFAHLVVLSFGLDCSRFLLVNL